MMKVFSRPLTLALLLLMVLRLGVAADHPNAAKAGMDSERLARIAQRMQAFVDQGTIAGVVGLIARHGTVVSLDAVGYQELEGKKAMKTDTIFQIMSMTKPVTAVALMILMEEGKVVLSDPVEKYLPEFRGIWMLDGKEPNFEASVTQDHTARPPDTHIGHGLRPAARRQRPALAHEPHTG
jgi:CubicO group peptidase (beta-lactamase class C family)